MNNSSCLILLVFIVAQVICQTPIPCKSPPQWEGRYEQSKFLTFLYKKSYLFFNIQRIFEHEETGQKGVRRSRIFYDSIYQRERLIEEYTLNSTSGAIDVIFLHKQKIIYEYDLKAKTCRKRENDRPWRDFGTPQNATSLGESYIGSSGIPNANVLTTVWADSFVDEKGNKINYRGIWTYKACIPISFAYYSDNGDYSNHVTFYDITPGIRDPNAFTPRPECLNL